MEIAFKSFAAALLGAFALFLLGQAFIKTNDLRNYPNLKPLAGRNNNQPGMADIDPQNPLANQDPKKLAEQAAPGSKEGMTKGEEEAAKKGFSTELENPNQ